MLYNYKEGKAADYETFLLGNLPPGIYGLYLLEEKLVRPDGSKDLDVFNTAFDDLDLKWDNIYKADTTVARKKRLSEIGHSYAGDFDSGLMSSAIISILDSTTGSGLPYEYAGYFLSYSANNFKPVGENKLYSPKEWFALIFNYGPLLVSVCRTDPATGKRFGHFVIVDGFLGSDSLAPNASCQMYIQDPMFGTMRGQLFPHFQNDCMDAISKVGTFPYIWHSNKTGVKNRTVSQCVTELEKNLWWLKDGRF